MSYKYNLRLNYRVISSLIMTQYSRFLGLTLFMAWTLLMHDPAFGQSEIVQGNHLGFEMKIQGIQPEDSDEFSPEGMHMNLVHESGYSSRINPNLCGEGQRHITHANTYLEGKPPIQGPFSYSKRLQIRVESQEIYEVDPCVDAPKSFATELKPTKHLNRNICDRTAEVIDAILEKLSGANDCAAVTSGQLAAITGDLRLESKNISSLKDTDFNGLTSLTELYLSQNDLTTLPDGLFDELTSLTILDLFGNDLQVLPDGIFDKLTSLTNISFDGNSLSLLPVGLFDELTSLERLSLSQNELSLLPVGLFDKLTSLTELWLGSNVLTELPEGIFNQLNSLTSLALNDNDLSILPDDLFDGLTSLTLLNLSQNELSVLPEGILEDLVELELDASFILLGLYLQDNLGAPFKPVVNLGEDFTVKPGSEVSIQADATGPWGDLVRWEWVQVDGPSSLIPTPDAIRLTGADTGSPSFTAPMEETDLHFKVVAIPGNIGEATERFGHANSDPDWITIRVRTDTNISAPSSIVDFALLGNYPNPFTSSTSIQLDLPYKADVFVEVFNMLGQKVHQEEFWGISAGVSRSLSFGLSNFPPGVYIYQVTAEMGVTKRRTGGRMTLIN